MSAAGFMFLLDFIDLVFRQIRQQFSLPDAQGFALGSSPTLQAFSNDGFVAYRGGVVEIGAEDLARQVLLRQEVLGMIVGIFVTFAVPQGNGITVR